MAGVVMTLKGVFDEEVQCRSKTTGLLKRTYTSKRDAKRAAKHTATKSQGTKSMEPYRCPHCDYWHVGHVRTDIKKPN